MSDEEQHCLSALAHLRQSYERDAKPYIHRLVAIESRRAPQAIFLTLPEVNVFGGTLSHILVAGEGGPP